MQSDTEIQRLCEKMSKHLTEGCDQDESGAAKPQESRFINYTEAKIGEEVEWPHREREKEVCVNVCDYTHICVRGGMLECVTCWNICNLIRWWNCIRWAENCSGKTIREVPTHTHTTLALASIERLGPGGRRGARGGEWGVRGGARRYREKMRSSPAARRP